MCLGKAMDVATPISHEDPTHDGAPESTRVPPLPPSPAPWSVVWTRAIVATVVGFFWTTLFWYQPARKWDLWKPYWKASDTFFAWLSGTDGIWRWVTRSYVMVALFILLLMLLGRKPKALGMGKMAQHGWRITALGYAIALPFLIWLGLRPSLQKYYANMFTDGGAERAFANMLVIAVEHALIEGGILALALPGKGFEEHGDEPRRTGMFAWLGFGRPEGAPGGWRGLLAWLGIPAWTLPAMVGQALIFGVVHAGKDFGELLSAYPGGLGLGLLTWRIRSVWPSVILHIGTGATILAVAYLASR